MIVKSALRTRGDFVSPFEGMMSEIEHTKNCIKAIYNFATMGGAVGDIALVDVFGNPVVLPAKAIVTKSWVDVVTALNSAGHTATAAVKSEGAGDMLSATAEADLQSGFLDGAVDGTLGTFVKMTAQRQVYLTVGTEALTAGKLGIFLEFVLSD